MIRFLLILLSISISLSANAIECIGVNQRVEQAASGEILKKDEVLLQTVFEDLVTLRMSADLGETHFFMQADKQSGRYLLMVTLGPDYTRGVTNSIVWDGTSQMRLTRVDGPNVFKLICN